MSCRVLSSDGAELNRPKSSESWHKNLLARPQHRLYFITLASQPHYSADFETTPHSCLYLLTMGGNQVFSWFIVQWLQNDKKSTWTARRCTSHARNKGNGACVQSEGSRIKKNKFDVSCSFFGHRPEINAVDVPLRDTLGIRRLEVFY